MTNHTLQNLRDMYEEEGLDYVLLHKINLADIEDEYARTLAQDAVEALTHFRAYVDGSTEEGL